MKTLKRLGALFAMLAITATTLLVSTPKPAAAAAGYCGGFSVAGSWLATNEVKPATTSVWVMQPNDSFHKFVGEYRRVAGTCTFKLYATRVIHINQLPTNTSTRIVKSNAGRWANPCKGGWYDGVYIPGSRITSNTHTFMTVKSTGGSYARISQWKRSPAGCMFTRVFVENGRVGANGLHAPLTRVVGNKTTPTGVYSMTMSFGNGSRTLTRLPYTVVKPGDYWVSDFNSRYFNQYRSLSHGGFNPSGSEHLADYPTQYRYAVSINFNMNPGAVPRRGSAIFLHVNGRAATAGCVSISKTGMETVMKNMVPGDLIAIGR